MAFLDNIGLQRLWNHITAKLASKANEIDLTSHTGDTTKHITADERTAWNAVEDNAKAYTDEAVAGLDEVILLSNATAAMPMNAQWNSIDYGNGKFVATQYGSSSYTAAYSADGANWTSVTLPVRRLNAVAYGDNKFVVISENYTNTIAYSTDGIVWQTTTKPSSEPLKVITYANGKFVAMGYGVAACSTDGIIWQENTSAPSQNWKSVAYGNGRFVAVANTGYAFYSEDGLNWTKSEEITGETSFSSITYGKDLFVVMSNGNSNQAAYSTDGINWNASTLPMTAGWKSVAYGNGGFVAVGNGGFDFNKETISSNTAAYSTDGINWNASTLPSSAEWSVVSYQNGKFIALTSNSNAVAFSEDGINWTNSVEYLTDTEGNSVVGKVKSIVTTGLATKAYVDEVVASLKITVEEVYQILDDVFDDAPLITVSQFGTYGFELNDNGYYESTNKGIANSAAVSKVTITVVSPQHLYFDCINYAEGSYDFGILSIIDHLLATSNTIDNQTVFKSFSGLSSPDVQTVDYGIIEAGTYSIYVKYRKDNTDNANNDSLQFKVRCEEV